MKKTLLLAFVAMLSITLSCKKKAGNGNPYTCENRTLAIGKWLFVERKITNIKTGQPSTRVYNDITTKFDPSSYIEFTNSNTYAWYEIYQGKVYRNANDAIECWPDGSLHIFRNKAERNTTIAEEIKVLTKDKLVFELIARDVNGLEVDVITTELKRVN